MIITHTFTVHFWLKKTSIRKDETIPIYARIWIDSIPVDVSTKQAIVEAQWCTTTGRVKAKTKNGKYINDILEDVNSQIKKAYRQLKDEGRLITSKAVKLRYLVKDKSVLTYKGLIAYHSENELQKLARGTIKNYGATEKYLGRFIQKEFKSTDIHLAQIDYSFIIKFENYLRSCPPLRKWQPLNNNGIMKHLERLLKFTTLAFKHGWIKLDPFALYTLKYEEFDCPFLEQFELDDIVKLTISDKSMRLVRDVFVFSCYTGLCYKVTLTMQNGNKFIIEAKNNNDKNRYIQSLRLNDVNYNTTWIDYINLQKGGVLDFDMGEKPNKDFGVEMTSRPFSISDNK